MSRIHEALKRAEEESKGRVTSITPEPAAVLDQPYVPEVDIVQVAEETASSEPPSSTKPEEWLANIPRREWKSDSKRLLFSNLNHHYEPGMEEFRTLRSRLYQVREKLALKTIMVSSALPGEGKSFVASNLAYALVRQRGRRILLIDADVRKPHMHECIGTSGTPGLNDYLAGDVDERAILQHGPIENLFFIPGGKPSSNPAELIANGRLKQLLDKLAPLFHWVLLDSPPIVPIADGSMIARCSDGILLVVRAESTPVDLVKRAKQELKTVPILGVVLNRGEENTEYSSYYYSYGRSSVKRKNSV